MRGGQIRVSRRVLLMMLGFSPDHRVMAVYEDWHGWVKGGDEVVIVIAGPTMPEVEEGECAPRVTVTYEQPERGLPRVVSVEPEAGAGTTK